jgi:hypothetical protein
MNSSDPLAEPAGEDMPDAVPPAPVSRYDATILQIAAERGEEKSFCPSEVARALSEDWRPLLTHVRAAARRLAEAGQIDILRHGKPIEPAAMKGVIRLRLKQA